VAKRDEYKVHMIDHRGRRCFTLVNAAGAAEAVQRAVDAHGHGPHAKKITVAVKTGRSFG
jgi:hypothetical protein